MDGYSKLNRQAGKARLENLRKLFVLSKFYMQNLNMFSVFNIVVGDDVPVLPWKLL